MQYIKFTHHYTKLELPVFTTIRKKGRKYKPETKVLIKAPKGNFNAVILDVERVKLKDLSTDFLMADTDKKTREDAVKLLNSFYRKPITENEELQVLFIGKILKDKQESV